MLVTLYKIGERFRLLGTNGFPVKAENEKFTAAGRVVENYTSSFGRLRQKIALKSVPHVQHDYFSSFNQSYHWFVAFSFFKLPNSKIRDENTKRYIIHPVIRVDYVSSLLIGKKALIQKRAQSKKWPVFNAHPFSYTKKEIFTLIANYNIDKTALFKIFKMREPGF